MFAKVNRRKPWGCKAAVTAKRLGCRVYELEVGVVARFNAVVTVAVPADVRPDELHDAVVEALIARSGDGLGLDYPELLDVAYEGDEGEEPKDPDAVQSVDLILVREEGCLVHRYPEEIAAAERRARRLRAACAS